MRVKSKLCKTQRKTANDVKCIENLWKMQTNNTEKVDEQRVMNKTFQFNGQYAALVIQISEAIFTKKQTLYPVW